MFSLGLPSFFGKLGALFGFRRKKSPIERQVNHLKKFIDYSSSGGQPPKENVDLSQLRITWVIPDFLPGAGGHMTIFRIAHYLESFGHKVSFLIQNPTVHKTGEQALATINERFLPFHGSIGLFTRQTPDAEGDALIATDRFTCYPVAAMDRFLRKFYFVQDYEPYFYPVGTEFLLTEATYHFDFDCLCAGDWLHGIMSEKYQRWAMSWPLAFDASVYTQAEGNKERSSNRIALYARHVTPRRAVELAFMALEILQERNVDFKVDFFGWKLGDLDVKFPYCDHGVLSAHELAALYREAAIGVVFSATNHSLVNKEMMSCGLPVIDLDLENVRAIFPEGAMCFAKPTPDDIADQIQHLLENPGKRESLRQGGLNFVKGLSWEKSARLVEAALKERVAYALGDGAP
ncbi:MAG: glycosyltransferase [Alphaproteobacteria bacterium]|nr:MAG: glycosyltransferase [Alphaproteobacteria bacterium]